jgi:hypothetical protein
MAEVVGRATRQAYTGEVMRAMRFVSMRRGVEKGQDGTA